MGRVPGPRVQGRRDIKLTSRDEKPLERYFIELPPRLSAALPQRCVVDGEVVVGGASGFDFDALLQRIHPARSRIERLARETPASFVAFDLLALGDDDLTSVAFADRRRALDELLGPAGILGPRRSRRRASY
ncbi:MAG: hypothetical protein ABR529_07500 [Actinomycetota bacterium]